MRTPWCPVFLLAAFAVPCGAQDILASYRQSFDISPFPSVAIDGERAAMLGSTYRLEEGAWDETADLPGTTHTVAADGGRFVSGNLIFQGVGVARIRRPTATGWVLEDSLSPSDARPNLYFGAGVAISGDVAAISARGWSPAGQATPIGAVYVFRSAASGWIEEQIIPPPAGDDFWIARAAIDGETLAVVGFRTQEGQRTVNVYQRIGGVWTHVALFPFPNSLNVNLDVAVQEDQPGVSATIVVHGSALETRAYTGYGTAWTIQTFAIGSDGGVALDGDVLALGDRSADLPGVPAAGSAHLYRRDVSGLWQFQRTLHANDPQPGAHFGWVMDLDGEWLAVGGETSTVEMFRVLELGQGEYCIGSQNSTGEVARITRSGSTSVAANDLELVAGPVPSSPGLFFYGTGQVQVPFGDGYRCVGGGPVYRLPLVVGTSGILTHRVDLTTPPNSAGQILPGSTHQFQALYRDPSGAGSGFNTSTGVELSFVP